MKKRVTQTLVVFAAFVFLFSLTGNCFAAKAAANPQVKAVQTALNKEGYSLKVDGHMGKQTHAALMKYQKANGLKATGKADEATLKKLGIK
jgi:peptidoglycan hydrolase-like protein with peptidoglycan-binding domain